MESFKRLIGFGEEECKTPDGKVSRSMCLKSAKSSPSSVRAKPPPKEDPGSKQGRMFACRRTHFRTVAENKRRAEETGMPLGMVGNIQVEAIAVRRETDAKERAIDLDISYSQLVTDLAKVEDDKELSVIKEAIRYLHHDGSIIRRLEKQEQGLIFPLVNAKKDESELVQQLRSELSHQSGEAKQLQSQIEVLTKERNKALDDLARARTESDAKGKKIAELNYTSRCADARIHEAQKQFAQLGKALDETRRMYGQEQSRTMRELAKTKEERGKLQDLLEEERSARKHVEKDYEDLQRENVAHIEELRASKLFNPVVKPSLNESMHQQQHTESAFNAVIECQNVIIPGQNLTRRRQVRCW